MRKFHLFAYDRYYPQGPCRDYQSSHDTLEEAVEASKGLRCDHVDILTVDEEGNLVVADW